MNKLTNQELEQIKGGVVSIKRADDIQNNNAIASCYCFYNNDQVIENNNAANWCDCICQK